MKDMDELGAAQEYLGYWLPPQNQVEEPVIGADAWGACRRMGRVPRGERPRVDRRLQGLRWREVQAAGSALA